MSEYRIDFLGGDPFNMIREHDFVAKALQEGEVWERTALQLWATECKTLTAAYVLDIGAYTGIYSLLAASCGAQHVVAFEPHPDNFRRLTDNVRLGDRFIRVEKMGLSDVVATRDLIVSGDSQLPSGSSVHPHTSRATIRIEPCVFTTGDRVRAALKHPIKLMKIDVEHHELQVLKGMRNTLKVDGPIIFIELLSVSERDQVTEFLAGFGYTSQLIAEDLQTLITDDMTPGPNRTNYIFRKGISHA